MRRRRFRQDRGRASRRVRDGDVGQAGRSGVPDDFARAPALHQLRRAPAGLPDQRRAAVAAGPRGRGQEDQRGRRERHRSTSSSAPMRCSPSRIDFKRLGLVIVDEEQHFGVAHKERLKALKADVHVLTLTATPIPRTLQMAMSRTARSVGHPDPAGRPARGPHLRHAVGRGGGSRGAAARALSRRPELLRRAAHRRSAQPRGMACRAGARSEGGHRPRPDERDPGRGADERFLRPQI